MQSSKWVDLKGAKFNNLPNASWVILYEKLKCTQACVQGCHFAVRWFHKNCMRLKGVSFRFTYARPMYPLKIRIRPDVWVQCKYKYFFCAGSISYYNNGATHAWCNVIVTNCEFPL